MNDVTRLKIRSVFGKIIFVYALFIQIKVFLILKCHFQEGGRNAITVVSTSLCPPAAGLVTPPSLKYRIFSKLGESECV